MRISNKVSVRIGLTLLWFLAALIFSLGLVEGENWVIQNGGWLFLVIGVINIFETYLLYQREQNLTKKVGE